MKKERKKILSEKRETYRRMGRRNINEYEEVNKKEDKRRLIHFFLNSFPSTSTIFERERRTKERTRSNEEMLRKLLTTK